MNPELCEAVYGQLLDVSKPGARFAYWNMLVPRQCPEGYAERVEHLDDFSQTMFEKDRAFFYSRFVVEEVKA